MADVKGGVSMLTTGAAVLLGGIPLMLFAIGYIGAMQAKSGGAMIESIWLMLAGILLGGALLGGQRDPVHGDNRLPMASTAEGFSADPSLARGRPCGQGSNRHKHLYGLPGYWTWHAGRVMRVIEGDPSESGTDRTDTSAHEVCHGTGR